jgi:hypothetical protein
VGEWPRWDGVAAYLEAKQEYHRVLDRHRRRTLLTEKEVTKRGTVEKKAVEKQTIGNEVN